MDERMTRAVGGRADRRGWFLMLTVLVLSIAAPVGHAAGEEVTPAPRELEVAKTLLNALTTRPAPTRDLVIARLIDRGEAVVPALLVAGRELRDVDQVEAIVGALRRLDRSSLSTYLLTYVSQGEEGPAASAAWRHLSKYGSADSIPAVIDGMAGNAPYLKRIVERTLVRLLIRHESYRTWDQIDSMLNKAPDETRARVICCIGETDASLGLELLARLIGRWPALDHAVVSAIARMPEAGLGEKVVPRLRALLESENMNVRREAVTALAVFADVESAKTLIEFLEDDRRGIRDNSLWALRSMSGLKFPGTSARWKVWYDDEVEWWEAEGEGLIEVLKSGTDLQIIEATRWLSEHRLYRTHFSPRLRKLLDHPSPEVREAAEVALVRLGLVEGRRAASPRSALAARGFRSVSQNEFERARARSPSSAPAGAARSSRIVPIVGLVVLGLLFLRIFGPALFYRVGRIWSGGPRPAGPMVVELKKPGNRRASRLSE